MTYIWKCMMLSLNVGIGSIFWVIGIFIFLGFIALILGAIDKYS